MRCECIERFQRGWESVKREAERKNTRPLHIWPGCTIVVGAVGIILAIGYILCLYMHPEMFANTYSSIGKSVLRIGIGLGWVVGFGTIAYRVGELYYRGRPVLPKN